MTTPTLLSDEAREILARLLPHLARMTEGERAGVRKTAAYFERVAGGPVGEWRIDWLKKLERKYARGAA